MKLLRPVSLNSLHFFLSRAGYKLEAAIEQLGVDVAGKVALDSGLSTGGFTDCLLQYGASVVYGVDVGYGQVLVIFSIIHLFLEATFYISCTDKLPFVSSNYYPKNDVLKGFPAN